MPAIGVWELVVILVIVLIIFGAGRLSEVGGALGKGVREFRRSTRDEHVAPPAAPSAAPSLASPSVVVENKCPSCATVNPPGQVFCGQCGTRLTGAA